jgi:hypothetical protein
MAKCRPVVIRPDHELSGPNNIAAPYILIMSEFNKLIKRVEDFHHAIFRLDIDTILRLLEVDPSLVRTTWELDDCMLALFKHLYKFNSRPSEEKQNKMLEVMDILFNHGYKVTLNRFFDINLVGERGITNLLYFFIGDGYYVYDPIPVKFFKKLLERMSDNDLIHLSSYRDTGHYNQEYENNIMDNYAIEIIKQVFKERYEGRIKNISHMTNLFSEANSGAGAVAIPAGGAGAPEPVYRIPSQMHKTPNIVRNIIGSYLSGKEGTIGKQTQFIRRKLDRRIAAVEQGKEATKAIKERKPLPDALVAEEAAAVKAILHAQKTNPIEDYSWSSNSNNNNENNNNNNNNENNNNNQNGGRRRRSGTRRLHRRKSKTTRRRKHA